MTDFDPTTNRIPFGLLTLEEQTVLKKWPHGFKFWLDDEWTSRAPAWDTDTVYRGKPAPVVVTTWSPIYGNGRVGFNYKSHDEAINAAKRELLIAILRLDITNGMASTTVEEVKK